MRHHLTPRGVLLIVAGTAGLIGGWWMVQYAWGMASAKPYFDVPMAVIIFLSAAAVGVAAGLAARAAAGAAGVGERLRVTAGVGVAVLAGGLAGAASAITLAPILVSLF